MIDVKNVAKSYGSSSVLKDCSLAVKEGSILGLVGVNGSGKSTLLRLMAGVYQPDEGSVRYNQQVIFDNPEAKKHLFFLGDEPFFGMNATIKSLALVYSSFYPAFTAEEFKKNLQLFDVNSSKPLREFSKGMRRKVYLASAFTAQVDVLLLDEIFDGLDALSRDIFKKELIRFLSEKEGRSAVVASHSLRELNDICDSFALLQDGKIHSGALSMEKSALKKIRLAFETPMPLSSFSGLKILHYEADGKFMTLVAEGEKDALEGYFAQFHPLVIDISEVSLEDEFIYETGVKV